MNKEQEEWRLDVIRISFRDYGKDKGSYIGEMTFKNKEEESFKFNLTPELSNKFLLLIKDQVVESANKLGQRLINSLPTK